MLRRASSNFAISASMEDLLSASVPSKSKTMSFFMGYEISGSEISNKVTVPFG